MPNYELIRDGRIERIADAGVDQVLESLINFYPKLIDEFPQLETLVMALIKKNLGQLGGLASLALGFFGSGSVLGLMKQLQGMEFLQDLAEDAAVDAAASWVAGQDADDPVCEALVELGLVKRLEAPAQPDPKPEPETDTSQSYSYSARQIGRIDRAPMAFFEGSDGKLTMSCIARTIGNRAPIWAMDADGNVQRRSVLPGANESGHYGFLFPDGTGVNLVPESEGEPIAFTAATADGPFERRSFKDLVPHSYTNLKWGFGYLCPKTKRQFLGFGNAGHPGMLLEYRAGWQLYAAPGNMRFQAAWLYWITAMCWSAAPMEAAGCSCLRRSPAGCWTAVNSRGGACCGHTMVSAS
jgi:hypothetical protein